MAMRNETKQKQTHSTETEVNEPSTRTSILGKVFIVNGFV